MWGSESSTDQLYDAYDDLEALAQEPGLKPLAPPRGSPAWSYKEPRHFQGLQERELERQVRKTLRLTYRNALQALGHDVALVRKSVPTTIDADPPARWQRPALASVWGPPPFFALPPYSAQNVKSSASSSSPKVGAPDGWRDIRKAFFPDELIDLSEVEIKYDAHWNELCQNIEKKDRLWSLDRAVRCAKQGEEYRFETKVELLKKAHVSTIRDAVDVLNTLEGHIACPEGFCVCLSSDVRRPGSGFRPVYFLLTRYDKNVDLRLLPEIQPVAHEANRVRILGQKSRMQKDTWATLEGWSRCCKGSPWTLKQVYAEIEADIKHTKARDTRAKRGRLPPELLGMGTTQERRPRVPFHRLAGFGVSDQSSTSSSQMRSSVSLPALTQSAASNE
mmetsp:Transcript_83477/g.131913  ORF Transcript_83477/g.131913 Transcript_83477/m.131913 type:complete len:391 (-) Transcript_83477:147-1319(-)